MLLSDLKSGQTAVIGEIPLDEEELKLFGIATGERITVLAVSPFRSAFLLHTRERRVSLPRETARKITVDVVCGR